MSANKNDPTNLVTCLTDVQTVAREIDEARIRFDEAAQELRESNFVHSMRNLLKDIRS